LPRRSPLQIWLLALLACAAAVVLSVVYIDRPVADFVEIHLHQLTLIAVIIRVLGPLKLVVVAGFAFLFGCGCQLLAGRRLPVWTRIPLLCSWSMVWALAATVVLKQIFGRDDPEVWVGHPPYHWHQAYGFNFLHGATGQDAFPSGTTAIATAILSVLWIVTPRLRSVLIAVFVLIVIALIIPSFHFVSDIIGGAFLGISTGWMTLQFWTAQQRNKS
jgi:membrane-associated phospholipid phosphatase